MNTGSVQFPEVASSQVFWETYGMGEDEYLKKYNLNSYLGPTTCYLGEVGQVSWHLWTKNPWVRPLGMAFFQFGGEAGNDVLNFLSFLPNHKTEVSMSPRQHDPVG